MIDRRLESRLQKLERMHEHHNHPEEIPVVGAFVVGLLMFAAILSFWAPAWWVDFWHLRWLEFARAVVLAGGQ